MEIPNTHLFVATFEDGTQIFQNEEDVSSIDPSKNCFFDVQEKEKESKLICFVLHGEPFYGVDLKDGHFEIGDENPYQFFQHRYDLPSEAYTDFRIIYLRNVQQHLNITHDPETGEILDQAMSGYTLSYTLGWQTTFDGKNIKKFIKTV